MFKIKVLKMEIENRKKEFKDRCHFVLGCENETVSMVADFIGYWTECSLRGKKMWFEFERVFDIKKRFATWKRNNEKWGTQKQLKSDAAQDALQAAKDKLKEKVQNSLK